MYFTGRTKIITHRVDLFGDSSTDPTFQEKDGKLHGKSSVHGTSLVCVLFVLETIRTSAMRVIHIIVKTEETQRLRIVFVLHCST